MVNFGFSSTEPSGGTNIRNMRTEAFYQDNYWIINGSKVMITNGGLAEVYCVIAKAGTKFHEGKSRS
jgi:alkylation response protein AidB-like acyl-CoA dehydrogenase